MTRRVDIYPVRWKGRGTVPIHAFAEDHVGRIYASGHWYEADLLQALHRRSRRHGSVIDVGAFVGGHSVWFSEIAGREVFACEAVPETFAVLQQNARGRTITPVHCAVGERPGWGRVIPGPPGNAGMNRIAVLAEAEKPNPLMSVPVLPLDVLVSTHNVLDVAVLKIDVEGAEPGVLWGARGLIADDRPVISTEAASPEQQAAVAATFKRIEEAEGVRYERLPEPFCATPTWIWVPK